MPRSTIKEVGSRCWIAGEKLPQAAKILGAKCRTLFDLEGLKSPFAVKHEVDLDSGRSFPIEDLIAHGKVIIQCTDFLEKQCFQGCPIDLIGRIQRTQGPDGTLDTGVEKVEFRVQDGLASGPPGKHREFARQ